MKITSRSVIFCYWVINRPTSMKNYINYHIVSYILVLMVWQLYAWDLLHFFICWSVLNGYSILWHFWYSVCLKIRFVHYYLWEESTWWYLIISIYYMYFPCLVLNGLYWYMMVLLVIVQAISVHACFYWMRYIGTCWSTIITIPPSQCKFISLCMLGAEWVVLKTTSLEI